ncbi:MAG: dihydrodipicolinate synthase family protein, partial [SAR324 cluster bacterium]|nr:dihydrodipicolinate synthase family protein [SAR324 cluster bacterium]
MEKIKTASLMTAIKTPYKPDGDIDLESYDRLVEAQINHGVEGLIVCGTTGEGHLMDWE